MSHTETTYRCEPSSTMCGTYLNKLQIFSSAKRAGTREGVFRFRILTGPLAALSAVVVIVDAPTKYVVHGEDDHERALVLHRCKHSRKDSGAVARNTGHIPQNRSSRFRREQHRHLLEDRPVSTSSRGHEQDVGDHKGNEQLLGFFAFLGLHHDDSVR